MFTPPKLLLTLVLLLFVQLAAHSQTLVWGSPMSPDFSSRLADSTGDPLDETFVFEIGAFQSGFNPTAENAADWAVNWRAFDAASFTHGTYDPITGYVTSTADMNPSGFSTSPNATSSTFNFSGLQAYLWVRNSNSPSPTTEWALVRATTWTFPTADPDCCPSALPVVWSVSDLTNETPIIGGQDGIEGSGFRSVFSPTSYLQTYIVPEPSATLLMGLAAFLVTRRRRD